MITLNCFTNGFANQSSSVSGKIPRYLQWVFFQDDFDGVTVFEDGHIWQIDTDKVNSKYKVGWLHEARVLRPENYQAAWALRHKFDCILTHDEELLSADPSKFRFTIRGGVTVPKSEWGMHDKSKDVAMILSDKRRLSNHRLRHDIANIVVGVDLYGSGIGKWEDKMCLKPYRFAVVVEASSEPNWFTDHLLDVISLGCIPIMYSPLQTKETHPLRDFIDVSGIQTFRSMSELSMIVSNARIFHESMYDFQADIIYKNIKRIADYEVTEDWFTKNSIADLVND